MLVAAGTEKKGKTKRNAANRNAKPLHVIEAGPKELAQHCQIEVQPREYHANGQPKLSGGRVVDQTPLDRYFQRGLLFPGDNEKNYLLFQAAERLRSDFHYAGLSLYAASSMEPKVSSGVRDKVANLRLDCLKRYRDAMASLNMSLRPVAVAVCCCNGSAQEWAEKNGQHPKAGIVVLRLTLAELAHYYGLLKMDVDMWGPHKLSVPA